MGARKPLTTTLSNMFMRYVIAFSICIFILPCLSLSAEPEYLSVSDEELTKITAALPAEATATPKQSRKLLVFSRSQGFRHSSIPLGAKAIELMGQKTGAYNVVHSDSYDAFDPENLAQFDAVFFNNGTGLDFPDPEHRRSLLDFARGGKGIAGIHSASDSFPGWITATRLIGGKFAGHPWGAGETAWSIQVREPDHPLNAAFEGYKSFKLADEIYVFNNYQNDELRVLLSLDLKDPITAAIHRESKFVPISWIRRYGRGRVFYCSLGHMHHVYWTPAILKHYLDGIQYALGDLRADDTAKPNDTLPPQQDKFDRVVLTEELVDPMELDIATDGRVFIAERGGVLKIYDPNTGRTSVAGSIGVHSQQEDGLLGLALSPDFDRDNYVYLMYSRPHQVDSMQHVSRLEIRDGLLINDSEVVMLRIPTLREACCHAGGCLQFGPDGYLFISTGDNTNPRNDAQASMLDERVGQAANDSQKSAANANDLRGAILRIRPHPDGTYSIPEGNLYPPGTPVTRPEIYCMGCRNPFRISIDSKNGFVYWGDIGPDNKDDADHAPKGYDEFNQARSAGNFGWPYFIADNQAYRDYDFATGAFGAHFDPRQPVNQSPNNTGPKHLPAAQPAFIWYPYESLPRFAELGTGGRSAIAGPVYHFDDKQESTNKLPAHYDNTLFIAEWMRQWIKAVMLDDDGKILRIEPFMPEEVFLRPIDLEIGPDGSVYVLEFGSGWENNQDSRLSRVDYVRGNRSPVAVAQAEKASGKHPLTVRFNADQSDDREDGNALKFEWRFSQVLEDAVSNERNPTFIYELTGTHVATLTVTDANGATSTDTVTVQVGNEPPNIELEIEGNPRFLKWDTEYHYRVRVTDAEDGNSTEGTIAPDRVLVRVDRRNLNDRGTASFTLEEFGLLKMKQSNSCFACHTLRDKSKGPPYLEVAKRYHDRPGEHEGLARKILEGNKGVWGQKDAMPAHKAFVCIEDARAMVAWIMSLADDPTQDFMPGLIGIFNTGPRPENSTGSTEVHLSAIYTDSGAPQFNAGPLTREVVVRKRIPSLELHHGTLSLLKHVDDLDLEGNIILAINCGGDGPVGTGPTVKGVKFLNDMLPLDNSDNSGDGKVNWHDRLYHVPIERMSGKVSTPSIQGLRYANRNTGDHKPANWNIGVWEGTHHFETSGKFGSSGLEQVLAIAGTQNLGTGSAKQISPRSINFQLATEPGRHYKLQMMFNYAANYGKDTNANVWVLPNGSTHVSPKHIGSLQPALSELDVYTSMEALGHTSGNRSHDAALLWTYEFEAESESTGIEITGAGHNIFDVAGLTLTELGLESGPSRNY